MISIIPQLKKRLSNSVVGYIIIISFILLLLVIHSKKFNKSRYQAKIVQEEFFTESTKIYCDLNYDGKSEYIIIKKKNEESQHIEFFNSESALFDKLMIEGELLISNTPDNILFEDFDLSGEKEIYLFSLNNDSVYLNIYEPYNKKFILNHFFIDELDNPNSKFNILCKVNYIENVDTDIVQELYCTINTGELLGPKNIYLIDINNRTIKKSPEFYGTLYGFEAADLDNDTKKEIIIGTYSTNNYPEDFPYSDYFSWLMVFDHQLNLYGSPIKYPRNIASTKPYIINRDDSNQILVLNDMRDISPSKSKLSILNSKLKVIREHELPETKHNCKHNIFPIPKEKQFLILLSCGDKWLVDYNLKHKHRVTNLGELPLILKGKIEANNNKTFILSQPNSNEFFITDDLFTKTAKIKIPFISMETCNISLQKRDGATPLIFLQQGTDSFWVEYKKNKWYYLQLFLYFSTFVIATGAAWYAVTILYEQKIRDAVTDKQLIFFKFQSLKNQLSPHFTYNALNSIGNLILLKENDKAYKLLTNFVKLKRALLENSDSNTRTLKEEIDFSKQYLEIQHHRFGNRLKAYFNIDPRVDLSIPVPSLTLHTYIENAIKHGLKDTEQGGRIDIEIINGGGNKILLIIRDNGVGRNAAKKSSSDTGKGLSIMEKYYELFEEYLGYKIETSINDVLNSKKQIAGTEVVVSIEKIKKPTITIKTKEA